MVYEQVVEECETLERALQAEQAAHAAERESYTLITRLGVIAHEMHLLREKVDFLATVTSASFREVQELKTLVLGAQLATSIMMRDVAGGATS